MLKIVKFLTYLINKVCSTNNPDNNIKQTNYNNIGKAIASNELGSLLDEVLNNNKDFLIFMSFFKTNR